jgi:hypothetical protein
MARREEEKARSVQLVRERFSTTSNPPAADHQAKDGGLKPDQKKSPSITARGFTISPNEI